MANPEEGWRLRQALAENAALHEVLRDRTIQELSRTNADLNDLVKDWERRYDSINEQLGWTESDLLALQLIIEKIQEIKPEDHATGSRDFGRGFSLALNLVKEIIRNNIRS